MTTPPFFVVGAQRSGTTMRRLMLNNHPRLAVPFESEFIPVSFHRLAEYDDLVDPWTVERLLKDISQHPKVEKGGLLPDWWFAWRLARLRRPFRARRADVAPVTIAAGRTEGIEP